MNVSCYTVDSVDELTCESMEEEAGLVTLVLRDTDDWSEDEEPMEEGAEEAIEIKAR